MALKNKEEKRALAQTYKTKKLSSLGITLLIRQSIIKRLHFNRNMINLLNGMDLILLNIDYHGKNVPYRYMSDILLNKVLIISDLILGK